MAVVFVLGFFLDFIEIAVVVVPIVAPILLADPSANITAVWLGVMIGVNIQTSFLTPPFGFALFYLRGVASKAIRTIDIYKGVIPFIILQLIALVIVGTFPPLVNYLPNRFYLSSFNAPPPMNPRLQHCVESYLAEVIFDDKNSIKISIGKLDTIDFAGLPESVGSKILDAKKSASSIFSDLEAVTNAQKVVGEATKAYSSIHSEVRILQREIRKIDKKAKRLNRELQIANNLEEKGYIEKEIEHVAIKRGDLLNLIPDEWESISKEYQDKLKILSKAERKYRRAMDDSYEGIEEVIKIISSGKGFESFKVLFQNLENSLEDLDKEAKQSGSEID